MKTREHKEIKSLFVVRRQCSTLLYENPLSKIREICGFHAFCIGEVNKKKGEVKEWRKKTAYIKKITSRTKSSQGICTLKEERIKAR